MCIRDREEEEEEGDEEPASALPQGFFDDQQADDKAHGRDLEAEMQEKLKSFEETMQTEQFEANLREASGAREQEETQELEEETTEYMEETVDQQIDFLSKMESLRARRKPKKQKKPSKEVKPKQQDAEQADGEEVDMDALLAGDDWRAKDGNAIDAGF
eukprot:TRINITY_DN2962_c0_g1_i2.p1 TRINITY_DN2962_c0_g1~~TRINITY_DN2962_c0_g1_i2.p1  ORF type:complete len:159 (+),score=74.99 TRINITY_DN2962_c0_g1_i2:130-606(+)